MTLRSNIGDPAILEDQVEEPIHTDLPENEEASRRVAEVLRHLTDLEREVVKMRAGSGLKHRQIGELLWPDESPEKGTRRSEKAYKRALKKIRTGYQRPSPATALAEAVGISPEMVRKALASSQSES